MGIFFIVGFFLDLVFFLFFIYDSLVFENNFILVDGNFEES